MHQVWIGTFFSIPGAKDSGNSADPDQYELVELQFSTDKDV